MSFSFGQRVRTTVESPTGLAPAGSFGTVIHPVDKWGDCGIVLDGDSSGSMHAFSENELILVADTPDWLRPLVQQHKPEENSAA
jgi:hypothetical protein